MSVLIGHASKGENGYRAQKAGDQTGLEVCTRYWYSRPWNCIIRANNQIIADKIAKAMEACCANAHVGYDMNDRTGLYYQARACGWDISKITTDCNTDCSACVAVCINAAGITVSKDCWTGNLEAACSATKEFSILTDPLYLDTDNYLKRGDILLNRQHHVAIALSNGGKVMATKISPYAAVVNVNTYLQVRESAGGAERKLGGQSMRLPNGLVVAICEESGGWGRLNDVENAWVSLAYLKKA